MNDMTTFCKTSQGGFNLDNVTYWEKGVLSKSIRVYLNDDRYVDLVDDEAIRALTILNGVCIFDTTEKTK